MSSSEALSGLILPIRSCDFRIMPCCFLSFAKAADKRIIFGRLLHSSSSTATRLSWSHLAHSQFRFPPPNKSSCVLILNFDSRKDNLTYVYIWRIHQQILSPFRLIWYVRRYSLDNWLESSLNHFSFDLMTYQYGCHCWETRNVEVIWTIYPDSVPGCLVTVAWPFEDVIEMLLLIGRLRYVGDGPLVFNDL